MCVVLCVMHPIRYAYETSVEFHVVDLQIMWGGRSGAAEPDNLLGDFSSPSYPARYMLVITLGLSLWLNE